MEELDLFVKFNMEAYIKMNMYNHGILKVEQLHVIASSLPDYLMA